MPAGAFGAVRPVGAIPPTATAAGPILLVKTFDFRSFFLHCQKRQFDELGKLANIVTRFSNTEEILNLSP